MADMTRKNENKDEVQDLPKKVSDKDATKVKGGGGHPMPPGPPADLAV